MASTTFQRATAAAQSLAANLFEHVPVACPTITVAGAGGRGTIVPDSYRLTDEALRYDIATYSGRVQAPDFTAIAVAVAVTAAAPATIDLSAEGTIEEIAVAEHLRALHVAFSVRRAGVEAATSLSGAADVLWRPDRTSGDTTVAMAVWELMPRVDAGLLPRAVTDDVEELIGQHLSAATLGQFQRMWRAALTGRPIPSRRATPVAWLALARQWLALHRQALPDVALPDFGAAAGELGWTANPTGDPLARNLAAQLTAAADAVRQEASAFSAQHAAHGRRTGASTAADGIVGAGGATSSGQRLVAWRAPDATDMKNRRTFATGLVVAGHRSPSIVPTPVAYPSGRLNPRALVARTAQANAGLPITAKPWTAMRSTARTSTRLRLAMVIDASATMQRWAQTTASLGWAASHAVAELGGLHALWGFGGSAFAVVDAGIAPSQVPVVLDPGSGSAGAGDAIRGATAAVDGDGVGLVVVVTDGALPDLTDVQDAVDDAVSAGFTVVWAMPDSDADRVRPRQAHVIDAQSPSTVAQSIADTAFSLLSAGRR